jgi:predicted CopG family antitoxin
MKNVTVAISDSEYAKLGIQGENISFSDLFTLISRELTRQNLSKCLELANKYGLSTMSMDEIIDEVKAVKS